MSQDGHLNKMNNLKKNNQVPIAQLLYFRSHCSNKISLLQHRVRTHRQILVDLCHVICVVESLECCGGLMALFLMR